MQEIIERIEEELKEIGKFTNITIQRHNKLFEFINNNDKFKELSKQQQRLLRRQLLDMSRTINSLNSYQSDLFQRWELSTMDKWYGNKNK